MMQHFISIDDAEGDLLACAAYLAQQMPPSDDRADAISAVIPRYLGRGEVDLAAQLADTVEDPHVRDRLLIAVATKCAELNDDEYALQLADAIEEYGLQSQAREAVALIKAGNGDLEKAREIAADVLHPDNVLAGIAIRQAEAGDEAAALDTVAEINYAGASTMAMLAMASIRLERSENENAEELLETAASLAEEIEHEEEKINALVDVGNAFADAGRRDKAIAVLDRARGLAEGLDNVYRDNLLAAVSQGFLRSGSIELADRTLDAVTDKTQIANTLVGFSREYWRRDEREEAFEALDEAYEVLRSQRDAETRDTRAKFALFVSIASQNAGFERGERAIEIAGSIEDDDQSMSALGQIAVIMTTQGRDELSRQAISTIPETANRVFALIGMSDAAAKNDEKEKALSLLEEARELAESVPQLAARSSAYNEIAERLIERGQEENAREVAALNLGTISEMRGESTKVKALATLSGLFERARFLLNADEKELVRSFLVQDRL
jgi:tetratricopeptide (TPR) repeat protein